MYNLDVHNLYDKVEGDMADTQWENGLVPDICPEYVTGFGNGTRALWIRRNGEAPVS